MNTNLWTNTFLAHTNVVHNLFLSRYYTGANTIPNAAAHLSDIYLWHKVSTMCSKEDGIEWNRLVILHRSKWSGGCKSTASAGQSGWLGRWQYWSGPAVALNRWIGVTAKLMQYQSTWDIISDMQAKLLVGSDSGLAWAWPGSGFGCKRNYINNSIQSCMRQSMR